MPATVTLNLNAEMEKELLARSQARGLSLDQYLSGDRRQPNRIAGLLDNAKPLKAPPEN